MDRTSGYYNNRAIAKKGGSSQPTSQEDEYDSDGVLKFITSSDNNNESGYDSDVSIKAESVFSIKSESNVSIKSESDVSIKSESDNGVKSESNIDIKSEANTSVQRESMMHSNGESYQQRSALKTPKKYTFHQDNSSDEDSDTNMSDGEDVELPRKRKHAQAKMFQRKRRNVNDY